MVIELLWLGLVLELFDPEQEILVGLAVLQLHHAHAVGHRRHRLELGVDGLHRAEQVQRAVDEVWLQVHQQAATEHAVEMAVARLRAALGTRVVQTVVKRGYRLATP